jgi:glucokinase
MALLEYWQARKPHVSYEWVCSGIGIGNIYEFLRETGRASEPHWLAERMAQADDPNPVIISTAMSKEVPICDQTLQIFISILGAETGNLALKLLATGGVYLGGGIPPRILPALQDGRFYQAFLHKGRFAELLRRIPVKVILNAKSALLGAAAYGLEISRT